MKLLLVSNLYPPHFVGGFELIAQDVAEGLSSYGWEVTVLTSTHDSGRRTQSNIWRWLPDPVHPRHPHWLYQLVVQYCVKYSVAQAVRQACPDLVLVTGMVGLPSTLWHWLRQTPLPLVFSIFDYYLATYPDLDHWYRSWNNLSPVRYKVVLKLLGRWLVQCAGLPTTTLPPRPQGDGVWYGSHYLAQFYHNKGVTFPSTTVLYPPIPAALLDIPAMTRTAGEPLRLLFAGRICREKGVHTVVQALAYLHQNQVTPLPELTLVGQPMDDAYTQELLQLIDMHRLSNYVHFLGRVPREQMPTVYAAHHVVVFATLIEEPFGMVPLEAMAAERAVVATATGGAREYLRYADNALLFAPDDMPALAHHLLQINQDEALRQRLARQGRAFARPFTDYPRFLTELDQFLHTVHCQYANRAKVI